MKYLVILFAVWQLASARTLPDYLQQYVCRRNDPFYEKCLKTSFEKTVDHFVNGIPELGLPPMDPFELPFMVVNRSINDLVTINAVCKNIKITGAKTTILEDLRADPVKHYGEIRTTVPSMHFDMDYDVNGHILVVPLQSEGHLEGNITDTQMVIKGSLTTYEKEGKKYFRTKKVNAKITIGDGHVKLTAKDKEFQYAADLIANFFNDNPRRFMDAINPIFIETTNELIRVMADQILATLPASEWLPE